MVETATANHSTSPNAADWALWSIVLIVIVTVLRIAALALSQVELYPDESQYWVWSREFDWGYFSKPPLIAWAIGVSTAILGVSDFAIRLPAPLFHAVTASFIMLTARQLAGPRAGFWAAIVYLTMPAVFLSSGIISTDAVMMSFWAAGLFAATRLRDQSSWPMAVLLGCAIGFGFLAKYAMIYFVIGTGLAILIDPPARRALVSLKGALAAIIGVLILLPNLLWNASNEFATLQHTAANANWGGSLFHFNEMAEFITAQLGVFGPALFLVLIFAAIASLRRALRFDGNPVRLLALYLLPALIVVSFQAFISRAHANWAASAYVAGSVLVTLVLLDGRKWRQILLYLSIAMATFAGMVFMAAALQPQWANDIGAANSFKRVRGWQASANAISQASQDADVDALMFDDRNVFHQMQRYGAAIETPIYMWRRYGGAHNHADMTWPLPDDFTGNVLVVSERPYDVPRMRDDFDRFEPAGSISIDLGGGHSRDFTLWRAQGYDRVLRDAEYEQRWAEIDASGGRD